MTARMVVMMTPEDKRALEERARAFDMTPSELVRRASENFEPAIDEALLAKLVDEFAANNAAMHETLSAALDRFDATMAEMRALRAAH
ncbi:MAG: hypothetical protein ACRCUI_07930, partial [Polymorphobacter sp.]